MTKRTVEIDDTLQDCVDDAISGVTEAIIDYLNDNPDSDEAPDMGDMDYSGRVHEIVDGAVPIYTSEVNDIMYLHGDEVERAFDNAGLGNKIDNEWPSGWKPAAIYCYIEQAVADWYGDNASDIYDDWREKHPVDNDADDAAPDTVTA